MSNEKVGRNSPCTCGSGKKFKQCCGNQPAVLAPLPPPPLTEAMRRLLMDAFTSFQQGQIEAAEQSCVKLLRTAPRQPDAIHILALIAQQRGQLDLAAERFLQAIATGRNNSMHSNYGAFLQSQGRHAEAVEQFRLALALNSNMPGAWSNLGLSLHSLGQFVEAADAFRRAIAIDGKLVPALNGLGTTLMIQRQFAEAEEFLAKAVALEPNDAGSLANLGSAYWSLRRLEEAADTYRRALELAPEHLVALGNLAATLTQLSRTDEARAIFKRIYALDPRIERQIQMDLTLPHIFPSEQALYARRAEFEQQVEAISNSGASAATKDLYSPTFFNLAFHGLNDRPLMQRIARMYGLLHPDLAFSAPHLESPRDPAKKLRIGFYSTNLHNHPVAHCFAALIEGLALIEDFDVYLISPATTFDYQGVALYKGFRGHRVQTPGDYMRTRQTIAAFELDVLVYQDIGMDELTYLLAFGRLARHQCVLGGHPVTTGIPNVDYFISSKLMEPANAAEHYSEKLIQLDNLPVYFDHPKLPEHMKTRAELGLPEQGALYVCPMMLQKLHPAFDRTIGELLERDQQGHAIFFKHPDAKWEEALSKRFDATIPASVRNRVHFLPWVGKKEDFIAINARADVIIDPFHFGIGSTAITTYAVCTPVVTLPGEFMRGRVGLAYCRLLEIENECVATDPADYVEKAYALANDAQLASSVRAKIGERKARLYGDSGVTAELVAWFGSLARVPDAEKSTH